jgi:hypothetical protein
MFVNKKRRLDVASLEVDGTASILGTLTVGSTVSAPSFVGGTITPSSMSLPNGSLGSPSLTLQSDPKSGIFYDTTGTAGLSVSAGGDLGK